MEREFRYGWPRPRWLWFAIPVVVSGWCAVFVALAHWQLERLALLESSGVASGGGYHAPPTWLLSAFAAALVGGSAVVVGLWAAATALLWASVKRASVRVTEDGVTVRRRSGSEVTVAWGAVGGLRVAHVPGYRSRASADATAAGVLRGRVASGTLLVLIADAGRISLGWTLAEPEELVERVRAHAGLAQVEQHLCSTTYSRT